MRPILFAASILFAPPVWAQQAEPTPPPAEPVPVAAAPAVVNPPINGPRIAISTTMGDIVLQLDSAHAPKSVANILRYVKEKHYDGTAVYRVAHGFVIQMGSFDAAGKGRGIHPGPVAYEGDNGLHNLRGTVALARAAALDSATAEFFISLVDNSKLDRDPADPTSGYAVFGQVASGMEVVDAIGAVPTGDNGPMPGQAPVTPIPIKKIVLLK